jgi:hypothetical protein
LQAAVRVLSRASPARVEGRASADLEATKPPLQWLCFVRGQAGEGCISRQNEISNNLPDRIRPVANKISYLVGRIPEIHFAALNAESQAG